MSKIKKIGIIALSLVTVVGLSGVTPAGAQSVSDLQAQISALLAQIQQLQAQIASTGGTTGGTGVAVSCNFTRNLYPEMSGSDVKCLQQYLNAAGYTVAASGVGSAGNETEYYGTLTKNAVTKWQDANGIQYGSWAGYFGPSSRTKYSALAASGSTGTTGGTGTVVTGVTIPSNALNVTLAAGNPLAASIPQGAYGVEYLKFNVAGNGVLYSLTAKRVGLGGSNDFTNVYLYDGDERLTSARTVNSTTNEVFFSGLNLDIRNEVKTLSLVVDVDSTNATAGEEDAFNLIGADASVTVNGLTVYGNTMKIAGTSVGSISVNSTSTPSNPSVGQKQAKLADFQLAAGTTEDIKINRIALTEGGNEQNTNLKNFNLKVGGEIVASTASIVDELLTFTFAEPLILEKGEVETFRVYGDVTGDARGSNTIVFYFETNSDIKATGATYGYPVTTTITGMDTTTAGATLTLQAGQITISFDGPVAGDISKNGNDVTLFEFSMTAQNNVEVRNTRFSASMTGRINGEDFTDFKMWDVDAGRVITSAFTIGTTTTATFTDNYNINSGETRNFKITADVDTDFDDGDDITVTLSAFQANDIKNLDNNTYVATADIVGDNVAGNTLTVRIPALDLQLAGTPASQTYVQGTKDVDFVGFTFRGVADDITLTELKVYASSTSGTITNSDLLSLRLIDSDTGEQLGNTEALTSSLTATFDNFELTINNGDTKKLLVRADISSNITNGDRPFIYVNALGDITARDSDGKTLTTSGSGLTGSTANSAQTSRITIASVGAVTVAKAPDDTDSEAGIIVMGGERTLAKFRFTATNEAMTLNKLDILVNNDNTSATATSTAIIDEVSTLKLYEGSTLLKTVTVQGSGASTGIAFVRSLGWTVPKDSSKTMTIKGVVNTATAGADSGQEVAAHIMAENFEAQGATSKDTTLTAASGNEKYVYKTKPTITVADPGTTLSTGEVEVLRFTVAADSNEQLAWKKIQLKVAMTDATLSAVTAAPGTTGNVKIRDISAGSNLNLSTAFSSTSTSTAEQAAITGGQTGYVALFLNAEQTISAGSSKQYGVYLTFANVDAGGNGGAVASVSLYKEESTVVAATTFNGVETATVDGTPSFIWSDYSATAHTEATADWANGVYVKELPSNAITVSQD